MSSEIHFKATSVGSRFAERYASVVPVGATSSVTMASRTAGNVPSISLLEPLDVGSRAELWSGSGRAVYVERGIAAAQPAADPDRIDITDMVSVEVTGENFVYLCHVRTQSK